MVTVSATVRGVTGQRADHVPFTSGACATRRGRHVVGLGLAALVLIGACDPPVAGTSEAARLPGVAFFTDDPETGVRCYYGDESISCLKVREPAQYAAVDAGRPEATRREQ